MKEIQSSQEMNGSIKREEGTWYVGVCTMDTPSLSIHVAPFSAASCLPPFVSLTNGEKQKRKWL